MQLRHLRQRNLKNAFMTLMLFLASVIAVLPLFAILIYVIQKGGPALNLAFFTEIPKPVGETGGGMANAIVGTLVLVSLASLIGIPIGIGAGVYLSEYGRGKLATALRFSIDLLASIPSIIVGLFAYAILVVPLKRFSALAGAAALAVIMVPIIARTTEELLRLVPQHIREAGLALGIPRWKVILRVVLRGSAGAIATGVMLAIARAAGETAPLLFTALNNQFWSHRLDEPIASLPMQIYTYAISPYDDWHGKAWGGALLLMLFVLSLNLGTRAILKNETHSRS